MCSQALEKSKYEQSLESVQRFIAIAEKELELYYRHIALYGDPNDTNPISILDGSEKSAEESKKSKELEKQKKVACGNDCFSTGTIEMEAHSTEYEISETDDSDGFENEGLSTSESDSESDNHFDSDSDDQEHSSRTQESSARIVQSSTFGKNECRFDNQRFC